VVQDAPDRYFAGPPQYPVEIKGTLLQPGQGSTVTISSELSNVYDVDIYTFRLMNGQSVTVDIEAETQFGRDFAIIDVGIYNGDLESIATVWTEADDTLPASDQADPYYTAQAVFAMPGHDQVIDPDPDNDGLATYYVVVTQKSDSSMDVLQEVPYQLTITTTAPQTVIDSPPSQLVWLAFDGATADFLADADNFTSLDVDRPAFSAADFDLENMRPGLIAAIKARIEQIYFEAGLDVVGLDDQGNPDTTETTGEIQFVLDKPEFGAVYSTVIFGGKISDGFFGLAESVDRHNSDREDMAVVMTREMARNFIMWMDDDDDVRFNQTVQILANTGAHELGHILGLEHSREMDTDEPNNIMGYYWTNYNEQMTMLEPQQFEERTSFMQFSERFYGFNYRQPGFQNEIDILLRNIGSGTPLGQ